MPSVMDSLTELSQDQLREVAARANFLLDPTGKRDVTDELEPAGNSTDEQMVWDELAIVAKRSGESAPPLPVFLRTKFAGKFRKAVKNMMVMIRGDFGTKAKVDQIKVVRLLVGLAATEANEMGRSVAPSVLTSSLQSPCALVDRHFPFYRTSGLLPMLVKRVRRV